MQDQKEPKPPKISFVSPIGLVLGIFFGIFIIVVVGLTLLFDVEALREPLAKKIREATGYQVEIQTLIFSFYPNFGLKAGGIQIQSGSSDRFVAESLLIQTDLKLLLKKQVSVKKIILFKPVLYIYSDQPGKKFLQSLDRPHIKSKRTNGRPPQGKSASFLVDKFKNFISRGNFTLKDFQVLQGRINFFPEEASSTKRKPLIFEVSTRLKVQRRDEQKVEVILGPTLVNPGNWTSTIQILDGLSPNASVQIELIANSLSLDELKALSYLIPGNLNDGLNHSNLSAKIENFSLVAIAPLNQLKNPNLLQQSTSAKWDFQVKGSVFKWKGFNISIPKLVAEGSMKKGVVSQNVRGDFLDGNFALDAVFKPIKKIGKTQPFYLNSHLIFNSLHIARVKYPESMVPIFADGRVSGTLRASGSLSNPIMVSGTLKGVDMVSSDLRFESPLVNIDLLSFKQLQGLAKFSFNGMRIDRINFQKCVGSLAFSPGNIRLKESHFYPGHGTVDLTGDFQPDGQFLNIKFLGKDLKAEEFWKEDLSGPFQFSGQIRGRIDEASANRGLLGKANVKFTDGRILKAEFVKALLQLLNLHTLLEQGEKGLGYIYLGGDFNLDEGVLLTDNLRLDASQLKLAAVGNTDLPTRKLNAEIKVMPLRLVDQLATAVPLLGDILTGGGKGGIIETHFKVSGTLDQPRITFNPAKSVLSTPNNVVKGVLDIPKSLLSGGK